jgi:hypothetical protein
MDSFGRTDAQLLDIGVPSGARTTSNKYGPILGNQGWETIVNKEF